MMTGKELTEHIHPSRPDHEEQEAENWWKPRPRYKRVMNRTLLLSQTEHIKLTAMRPVCDLCDKSVDGFAWTFTGPEVAFVATCHGEMETVKVNTEEILDMIATGVTGGRAFIRPKRLK